MVYDPDPLKLGSSSWSKAPFFIMFSYFFRSCVRNNSIDQHDLMCALHTGNLKTVKYFVENKTTINVFNTFIINTAAVAGHLDIVRYLFDSGLPIDYGTIESAINSGNIDIVKYLFENGAPVRQFATSMAVSHITTDHHEKISIVARNRLEILDYLVFNGAPYCEFIIKIEKYRKIYRDLFNNLIINDISIIIVSYLI